MTVLKHLLEHNPGDICISAITYSELVYGIEKSQSVDKNRLALTMLLANIEIIDFDSRAAESFGKIKSTLEKTGTSIGIMDTLIAAHAQSLGYTIVTNNTREFKRVYNLNIENWAE